jgi:PAS domain S-box-containing protein
MNPRKHPEAQTQTPGLCSRLAWLPIPLLISAILVLKALGWQTVHESEILMMLCNFVFSTLASLLVVVLFGRSFLARGMPGMLWFGCGVLLWGAAGTVAPALLTHGINVIISVHNILVCLSAFCQLAGAILLLKPPTAFREAGPPLVVAHATALGVVALVTVMVLEKRLPVFFVQGMGGTTLRYVVLASATVMFALAAALLWTINRRTPTVFVRWYGPALLLVATGLFGIMIESVHGGALSWTGRVAQFLGGAYMLVAALVSVRESGAWKVSLSEALQHAREAVRVGEERYSMLFDAMTEGFALHEIVTDEEGRPCDYRFLEMNPAFERLTGLKRADLIGKRVLDVMPDTESIWIDGYGKVALTGEPLHMENYSTALKRWYEVYAYRTEQGRFAVVFSDITERKKAEDALADAKNKMEQERDILQAVMDGAKNLHLVYLDRDFNFVRVNETYAQTCGFRPEEMIGKNHFALYPHEENEAIFKQARDKGETLAFHDKPFEFPDQPERGVTYWDWTLTPVKDARGQVTGLVFSLFETTERKRAEDALRESEQFNKAVLDTAGSLVVVLDMEGRIRRFNQACEAVTGYSAADVLGRVFWEFLVPNDNLDGVRLTWESLLAGDFPNCHENQWIAKDDTRRLITWTNTAIVRNGKPEYIIGTGLDITERKKVEEALRNSERLYRAIGESIDYGVWVCDPDGRNTYASESFLKLVGLTQDQCSNFGWGEVLHPDDAERTISAWKECVRTGGNWDIEHRFRSVDGEWHPILARGVPVRNERGEVVSWAGINLDISRMKQAEDALKQLNEELEDRVAERTEELATTIDNLQIEIVEREKAEKSLMRLNRLYAMVSETNQAIIRTRDRETLFSDFCRIAVEDGCFKLAWVGLLDEESGELKMVAANGATGYLDDIKITVNEEPEGLGPTGISVREGTYFICNDFLASPVTRPWHERGKAHGIRASASIALKQEGRVIGALTLYADKKDFFDQDQVKLLRQMGVDISFALDNICRENRRLRAEQDLQVETLERLRVVEALREKEQMLLQQSRQAAMGEMISNIAHQWRQPLNALGLTVQQLPLFYDLGEFTREFLEKNVNSSMKLIQHMSKTIDDFRNYFRPDKEKVKFYLSESITDTLSLVNASFKDQNIDIEIIAKHDAVIYGYRNEFAQVLLNILNNARDALIEREIKDPRVTITICEESNRAILTVTDNAGGIPEENLSKIFDPYFSTKGPQAGTGVGLYMSKNIIEKNMGGTLTVRNIGDGAEFRIEV